MKWASVILLILLPAGLWAQPMPATNWYGQALRKIHFGMRACCVVRLAAN